MEGIDRISIKRTIRNQLKKNGIKKASLFGSFHSGNFDENSDIDILIEANDDMSLMDLARIKREIEEVAGFRVDIMTYRSLDPRYKELFMSNSEELI